MYMEAGLPVLHSHRGSSYGGFVQPVGQSVDDCFWLVEGLMEEARRLNFKRIILTLPPVVYNQRLTNYLEFALFRKHFSYLKREISSVLLLEDDPELNYAKFKPASLRAARKAERSGVEVNLSDDYERFYAILKKNLKIRHNVQPTHTLDELKLLASLFPDRIRLYAAMLQETMIAGVVIFDANPQVTLAFYISHDEDYQEYRAVNLLFRELIADSIKRGFRYLDYGIFTVNMEPNFGLARFKESFGSSGIFRDTLVLDL
jgi:lipid II:glycine glycyltransferase (peptidoglycan interpeptide bridge formation enzyme)